ncbi:VanW family protein [Candidatus Peribacteria bacterium]|nr:VanW family protein [Candidatus Peribacteria bacterium]
MKRWLLLVSLSVGTGLSHAALPEQFILDLPEGTYTVDLTENETLLSTVMRPVVRLGELALPYAPAVDTPEVLAGADPVYPHYVTLEANTTLDGAALEAYLTRRGAVRPVGNTPVNIEKTDTGVRITGRPSLGYWLDIPLLIRLVEAVPTLGTPHIALQGQLLSPPITVEDSLYREGIREIIGIGESYYYGSPADRRTNIAVATALYNGVRLDPGEVFSFNRILEPHFSAANGFKEELVIKGETTEKELGGGVCQVSTTVFRAAIDAGLEIVERSPHSYAVPYYREPSGHGLDATVYFGVKDFRFRNDTENPILIQSYTEGSGLYFVFYGTQDGRTVTLESEGTWGYHSAGEPEIRYTTELPPGAEEEVNHAKQGFQAQWERTVHYADGTEDTDTYYSNYRAVAAEILRGAAATPVVPTPEPAVTPTPAALEAPIPTPRVFAPPVITPPSTPTSATTEPSDTPTTPPIEPKRDPRLEYMRSRQ